MAKEGSDQVRRIESDEVASKHLSIEGQEETFAIKKQKKRTTWRKLQVNSQVGSNTVPSVKSMKEASSRLRRIRWKIYHEGEKSKVKYLLDNFKTLVGEFLDKFKRG